MSDAKSTPRPKWRFRIFQFSIRTLLLVTAAVAVFCNWYFQPERRDEELAGGLLKLRRQVRVEMVDGVPPNLRSPALGATPPPAPKVPIYISHGTSSLRDSDDNLLVRGEYANDVPTGWWTIWHVSGKKAAEGRMKQGAKCGVWRTWYEDGTPQSLVTYATVAPPAKKPASGSSTAARPRKKSPLQMSAFPREGETKAWYPSGKLKFAGSYKGDKEEGPWQFYDEEGKLVADGSPSP
jgi:hypothetical protein